MRVRMAALTICTLTACVLLFIVLRVVGGSVLTSTFQSDKANQTRLTETLKSFNDFVEEEGVSSEDTAKLAEWSFDHPNFNLIVYKNEEPVFESGTYDYYNETPYTNVGELAFADTGAEGFQVFDVKMANGMAQVALKDYSSGDDLMWLNALCLLICSAVLTATLSAYYNKNTKRIVELDRRVSSMAAGSLDEKIVVDGSDELTHLGENLDSMRRAFIERLDSEQSAMTANSELITAISHDLRTPLTALLGYLDIVEAGRFASDEQRDKYVRSCREKAYQIKSMTDELFRYFLAFDVDRHANAELVELSAEELLDRIINEHVTYVTEHGYSVHVGIAPGGRAALVELEGLTRVFDNIFSNIEKYADKSATISIRSIEADDHVSIEVSNACKKDVGNVESTCIGLKTCQRIMSLMGGSFVSSNRGGWFTAIVTMRLS